MRKAASLAAVIALAWFAEGRLGISEALRAGRYARAAAGCLAIYAGAAAVHALAGARGGTPVVFLEDFWRLILGYCVLGASAALALTVAAAAFGAAVPPWPAVAVAFLVLSD